MYLWAIAFVCLITIQGLYYLYYTANNHDNNTAVCENAVSYAVLNNILVSFVHFIGHDGTVRFLWYAHFGKVPEDRGYQKPYYRYL